MIGTPNLRLGPQRVAGTASDAAGIGLARVEVNIAGSGWQTVVFDLSADALTPQLGSVTTALQTAAFIRLYNSFNPGFPGDTSVSSLGVDNITAVPEPAAVTLTAAGLLLLTALAGRHSKAAGSRASPA